MFALGQFGLQFAAPLGVDGGFDVALQRPLRLLVFRQGSFEFAPIPGMFGGRALERFASLVLHRHRLLELEDMLRRVVLRRVQFLLPRLQQGLFDRGGFRQGPALLVNFLQLLLQAGERLFVRGQLGFQFGLTFGVGALRGQRPGQFFDFLLRVGPAVFQFVRLGIELGFLGGPATFHGLQLAPGGFQFDLQGLAGHLALRQGIFQCLQLRRIVHGLQLILEGRLHALDFREGRFEFRSPRGVLGHLPFKVFAALGFLHQHSLQPEQFVRHEIAELHERAPASGQVGLFGLAALGGHERLMLALLRQFLKAPLGLLILLDGRLQFAAAFGVLGCLLLHRFAALRFLHQRFLQSLELLSHRRLEGIALRQSAFGPDGFSGRVRRRRFRPGAIGNSRKAGGGGLRLRSAEAFRFVGHGRFRGAEQKDRGLDDQFQRGDRFGNQIVAAAQQTFGAILIVAMQRHKNHRRILVMRHRAQFPAQLDAIRARQVNVQQDQVERVILEQVEGGARVGGDGGIVVGAFEGDFVPHVADRVVVHEENAAFERGFRQTGVPTAKQTVQTVQRLRQGLERGGGHAAFQPVQVIEQHGFQSAGELGNFAATRQSRSRAQRADALVDFSQEFLAFRRTEALAILRVQLPDGRHFRAASGEERRFQFLRRSGPARVRDLAKRGGLIAHVGLRQAQQRAGDRDQL